MHTAEPLVLKPSCFEVEIVIEKLKNYKSPSIYHIPAEPIHNGGILLRSEIHSFE